MSSNLSVVFIGATGAVGGHASASLSTHPDVAKLTLIGRREATHLSSEKVAQHVADLSDPTSYREVLQGHDTAVCTLGIGQPSKVSREEFERVDHDYVLDFAKACKAAGVRHFALLSSVGADAGSSNYYLRTKGRLEEELAALEFDRLSVFRPSMILTPTNRYGFSQAVALRLTPLLKPLLMGPLRKFRGVPVDLLGRAIAASVLQPGGRVETHYWDDFNALLRQTN
ncbi:MAG: NAD(P)H-binding protein [Rhodothermales bacterium]|nr:NAD(P)H-binding protein [Rhodothermales bacterium]